MAFPKSLPIPTRDNYTGAPSLPTRRFKMDDGQYFQQRQGNRNPFKYSLTWKLTYAQTDLFAAWLEYDVSQGSGEAQVPIMGRQVTVKPTTGVASYTPSGNKWAVTLEVEEILSAPVVSARSGVLPEWPAEFPEFDSPSYTLSMPDSVTASDIDTGRNELRTRFSQRVTQASGSMLMSQAQRDAFWLFWKDSLINGNAWFLAPFVNARFSGKLRARICTAPSETPNGAMYTITMTIETANAPSMGRAEYQAKRDI